MAAESPERKRAAVKVFGLAILFQGAECAASPIGDRGSGVELAERILRFCAEVNKDPDIACCLASLHEHHPGTCARRSDDQ